MNARAAKRHVPCAGKPDALRAIPIRNGAGVVVGRLCECGAPLDALTATAVDTVRAARAKASTPRTVTCAREGCGKTFAAVRGGFARRYHDDACAALVRLVQRRDARVKAFRARHRASCSGCTRYAAMHDDAEAGP